jgi:hypothetical protein
MKKKVHSLCWGILISIATSCSARLKSTNMPMRYFDEFKNESKVLFKQSYGSIEKSSSIQFIELELVANENFVDNSVKMYLRVKRNYPSQIVKRNFYIKTASQKTFIIPIIHIILIFKM